MGPAPGFSQGLFLALNRRRKYFLLQEILGHCSWQSGGHLQVDFDEIKNVDNFVNNALNEERSLISDHAEMPSL